MHVLVINCGSSSLKFDVINIDSQETVVRGIVDDFIPPTYPMEVELQTLAAVLECTSRALLPEHYRSLEREQAIRRVEELKVLTGERR